MNGVLGCLAVIGYTVLYYLVAKAVFKTYPVLIQLEWISMLIIAITYVIGLRGFASLFKS